MTEPGREQSTTAPVRGGAVAEVPFWLEVNGRRAAAWSCSPGHLDALALGWLLAAGYLEVGDPLPALEVVEGEGVAGVRARLADLQVARGDAERRHRSEHGCGALHFSRCAPELLPPRALPGGLPDGAALPALFRALYAAAARYRESGGLHSAALSDGERLFFQTEEVGRHNAVDKAIGRAWLAGRDPAGLGLVTTARISAEIAVKAARAGLAWVASRSVPTTLALEVAGAASLPVLARAAGREARLHPGGPASGGDE